MYLTCILEIFPFKSFWTTENAAEPRRSGGEPPSEHEVSVCTLAVIHKLTKHFDEAFTGIQELCGIDAWLERDLCERLVGRVNRLRLHLYINGQK